MNLFQFRENMPGKLGDISKFKLRWSAKDVQTIHSINSTRALATDTKFYGICRMYKGMGERKGFLAMLKDGSYVAEIQDTDTTQIALVKPDKNGKYQFKAAIKDGKGTLRKYEDTRSGSVLFLALMPTILADMEAAETVREMEKYLKISPEADDWDFGNTAEDFSKLLCKFSNNIYYRVQFSSSSTSPIEVGEIKQLRSTDLKKEVKMVLFGTSDNFASPTNVKSSTKKAKKGAYALSSSIAKDCPDMPEYYQLPNWVDSCSRVIKESSSFEQPFRNILLTGPAGTGKTTGVKAMASLMGLPYGKITCNPDTDIFDLIGQMLPNTETEITLEETCQNLNIPTFEDVENDFDNSFKNLFGREPDKMATPSMCYEKITEMVLKHAPGKKDFLFVESDLVKFYREGGFIEIQEPTVLKRSAVLVGLNSMLENASSYTLPTGEVIKRHPNCVICLTTNSDYDGCNMIQQSVLSRMDIVREVPNPTVSELKERTMTQTGFKEEKKLLQMAEMIEKINEFCKEQDISDGVCGPRELANWAKMTMILSKVREEQISDEIICQAAFSTLISKVSQDKEDAEAVISGCLALTYSGSAIEDGREAYENGIF